MAAPIREIVHFANWPDPAGGQLISQQSDIKMVAMAKTAPDAQNWAALERAHGYMLSSLTLPPSQWDVADPLFKRAASLLAVCTTGAGYDPLDVDACTRAGVLACCQVGANKEAVAEHALGLMLALSKRIGITDHALRDLDVLDREKYWGHDIVGMTLGVVGIGNIGARLAELCRGPLRMKVLAYDPLLTAEQIRARGAEPVSLPDLLKQSDFVSVHCPRSKETTNMFNRAAFAAMKPTAYFLNTARHGIHNEADLYDALKSNVIAGAGIDVFENEPPPRSHPLFTLENIIVTPHIAGVTYESRRNMAVEGANQWMAILRGEIPPEGRLINPEVLPRYAGRFEKILGFRPKVPT